MEGAKINQVLRVFASSCQFLRARAKRARMIVLHLLTGRRRSRACLTAFGWEEHQVTRATIATVDTSVWVPYLEDDAELGLHPRRELAHALAGDAEAAAQVGRRAAALHRRAVR